MAAKENKRVTPKGTKKVSTAKQWKSGGTTELEVPSGNVCLVRKPDGMKAFMVNGKIPNSLMPLVAAALDEKSSNDGELDMQAILADPEKMNDMMALIDSITVATVVEPVVHPVPSGDVGRNDDMLYVDEIDMEDKLMIMGFALGGVKDLETFRRSTTDHVASLADVSELSDSTLIIAGSD